MVTCKYCAPAAPVEDVQADELVKLQRESLWGEHEFEVMEEMRLVYEILLADTFEATVVAAK